MNYELAKQLKDAGFPQEGKGLYWEPTYFGYTGEKVDKPKTEHCVYLPTLSELIESCGDKFGQLVQCDRFKGEGWFAIGCPTKWEDDGVLNIQEEGETPEEAVAKLWLKLNKEE